MTPLMASHKEAGAMGWLGRDRLNLCEGAGAGEGTAAPAKTARPSALPPGGPEPEVSRAAQPSAPPTEALGGMCACRLSARSVVRGAWVAPPPARQGSSSGDRAGVPLCAGDPAGSSREPQQRLLAAVASQNVSPSPRRHAVWLCVGLRSSFRTQFRRTGLPRTKGPQPNTPQAAIYIVSYYASSDDINAASLLSTTFKRLCGSLQWRMRC